MGRARRGAAALIVALVLGGTLATHHSPVTFDLRREVTLTGVVTGFRFRIPHLFFIWKSPARAGLEGKWEIEAQSPRVMSVYGWSAKSLAPGDRVSVVVNPPQQRNKELALGRSVQKSDGTTLPIPWDREEIRKVLREQGGTR